MPPIIQVVSPPSTHHRVVSTEQQRSWAGVVAGGRDEELAEKDDERRVRPREEKWLALCFATANEAARIVLDDDYEPWACDGSPSAASRRSAAGESGAFQAGLANLKI